MMPKETGDAARGAGVNGVGAASGAAAHQVPAVHLEGYSFAYAGVEAPTLSDVSFSLPQGSFAVLCGATGCGKSTLLRALKPELAVEGTSTGRIEILGDDPASLDPRESAARIGFVMQDPENQLVTDTVWHELAFGLENLATPQQEMRRRVAETAHFFGIGAWFERKVSDLSGGQKQLLNLAAVVVMQPKLLVLDEPTSQLDPIAAKSFFDVLGRVNAELGITVVIVEHRLEDVLPMADRVFYLADGTLRFDGTPGEFIDGLIADGSPFVRALPAATRIAALVGHRGAEQPVTVRQGRSFLEGLLQGQGATAVGVPSAGDDDGRDGAVGGVAASGGLARSKGAHDLTGEVVLRCRDLWFRYDKESPFVLRGVDLEVRRGCIHALVGGNGSGKSTLLGALSGVRKPERGRVRKVGDARIALLAQDPKSLFVCDTLADDLLEWRDYGSYGEAEMRAMMERLGLVGLEGRHPYDLSGGEAQKAALAKVLLLDPDVLLLDEPVKGVDAVAKQVIARTFAELATAGKAVLFTAHDLEFVSEVADLCSMMFGCEVTCTQDCKGFFTDNLFYSTATSRITRGLLDGCVTTGDVAGALEQRGLLAVAGMAGGGRHDA